MFKKKDQELLAEAYKFIVSESSKIDWFKFLYDESKIEIAKRVKATPTKTLEKLASGDHSKSRGAQLFQHELILKELDYRNANGDINKDGDSRYTGKYKGYDRL